MRTFPHVPIFQKTYKSYRMSFLVLGNIKYGLYSMQTLSPMECPHKKKRVCVCLTQL